MEIPVEIFIRQYVHLGAVLYIEEKNMPHPHYYIIINDPGKDDLLIMPVCGHNYQKTNEVVFKKDKGNTSAFVYISPEESKIFPKETGIDCGGLKICSCIEFSSLYETKSITYKGDMEEYLLKKIIKAAKNSHRVAPDIKEMLN